MRHTSSVNFTLLSFSSATQRQFAGELRFAGAVVSGPGRPQVGVHSGFSHRIDSRVREAVLVDSGPIGAGKTI